MSGWICLEVRVTFELELSMGQGMRGRKGEGEKLEAGLKRCIWSRAMVGLSERKASLVHSKLSFGKLEKSESKAKPWWATQRKVSRDLIPSFSSVIALPSVQALISISITRRNGPVHKSQQPFTGYLSGRLLVYPEVLVMVCRILWFIFILYHYIFIRIATLQNRDNTKCLWGYEAIRNSYSLLIVIQIWYSHFGRQSGGLLQD